MLSMWCITVALLAFFWGYAVIEALIQWPDSPTKIAKNVKQNPKIKPTVVKVDYYIIYFWVCLEHSYESELYCDQALY